MAIVSPELKAWPGALILVVGPSGAGKDAVMRRARESLGTDPPIRFARRVVTRPADPSENHEAASAADFAEAARRGDFALTWQAHGLRYGVPRKVFEGQAAGHAVVVNGSRAAVARARQTFASVRVVLITAPPPILAARINMRGRDADVPQRLAREPVGLADLRPDLVIDNAGPLEKAVAEFLGFLHRVTTAPSGAGPSEVHGRSDGRSNL